MILLYLCGYLYNNMAAKFITSEEIQNYRMQQDIKKYNDIVEGEYKNYKWKMKRRNKEYVDGKYWCGYIYFPKQKWNDEQFSELYQCLHGGITYGSSGVVGFDCAHWDDYPVYKSETAVFRNYQYVYRNITRFIDKMIKIQC
jgi:hypothetical protein